MQKQITLVLALFLYINLSPASGTSDVGSPVTSLLTVKRDNDELKKELADLRRLLTEIRAAQIRHTLTSCSRDNAATSESLGNSSGGGASYIRWGRTSCPPESELVYKGFVGGGHHRHSGAAPNYQCLPEDPQFTTSVRPLHYSALYGTEYETFNLLVEHYDHDVPCSLCRSPTRSSAVMIPARTSCYPGFHREYEGYLMASLYAHPAGTDYICVDQKPEDVVGGTRSNNENLLYFTISHCGSLKCPPYKDFQIINCIVCSK